MAKSKKFFNTTTEPVDPCTTCSLKETCKSPKLPFIGKGKKNVLIIGAQPSSEEDLKGGLGRGSEFNFLDMTLEDIGIDIMEDCFYVTAVGCRPPRDRAPSGA